jgi:hypothetical protein
VDRGTILQATLDRYISHAKRHLERYKLHEKYNLKTLGHPASQLIGELNEHRQQTFSLADVHNITGLSLPVLRASLVTPIETPNFASSGAILGRTSAQHLQARPS